LTILTTRALSHMRFPLIDYAKDIRVIRLPVWQRSPTIFRRMLLLQGLWAISILLHGTEIFQVRGLTPESNILAQLARRTGAKTICVPMASGIYGDAISFRGRIAFDRISALTEPMRQEIMALGIPAEHTVVIPNGVDIEFFRPADQSVSEPRV